MSLSISDLPMASADAFAMECARDRWNAIAKPIGSLGALEDMVVQIAGLTGSADVDLSKRCITVLCADNGVVARGVSQCGPEVTRVVAENVARGTSSLCKLCAPASIDCLAVDMGMRERSLVKGVIDRRIAAGTRDITRGPAMTYEDAARAIEVGIDLVGELAQAGYRIVGTGEMGIGNTTTATAMTCAFLGKEPEVLVGRGAGLSDAGLVRKTEAVRRALLVNEPDASDPLDVLTKLGGFDIAGMCGMFLGGAIHRVPIVIDGMISMVAACCALQLRPECRCAMLPSHLSSEPAARMLAQHLGFEPVLHAGIYLGEGTGAACLIPLLDMALSLYREGTTFEACGLAPYEVRP